MASQNQYSPTGATTALAKRAEAAAPGAFEAQIRFLFFLARRVTEQTGLEGEALAVREFGIQFRKTAERVEAAEAAALSDLDDIDWKAEMEKL